MARRIVRLIRAIANGVEAFQGTLSPVIGQPAPPTPMIAPVPEDRSPNDEPLSADNPYLDPFDALRLADILDTSISTFQLLANAAPGNAFQAIKEVNWASVGLITRDPDGSSSISQEQMDKGLLFEVARLAHHQFHEDTDPDQMWAPDEQLSWHINDVVLPISTYVHAFMDFAFRANLDKAIQVSDWLVEQALEVHGEIGDQGFAESLARRNFAAMLLLELAGTLSAQTMSDLIQIEGRPIAVTMQEDVDDLESRGDDDE